MTHYQTVLSGMCSFPILKRSGFSVCVVSNLLSEQKRVLAKRLLRSVLQMDVDESDVFTSPQVWSLSTFVSHLLPVQTQNLAMHHQLRRTNQGGEKNWME